MLTEANCFCISNITVITHSSAQHVDIYIYLPTEEGREPILLLWLPYKRLLKLNPVQTRKQGFSNQTEVKHSQKSLISDGTKH